MRFSTGYHAFVVLALLAGGVDRVSSVLYGDEQYGDIEGGRFWAFTSAGIAIVNPESCSVEKTITKGPDGSFLPSQWYDGIYMEKQTSLKASNDRRSLSHPEKEAGLVMINSGITVEDGHENPGGGTGEVYTISADPKDYDNAVKSVVKVGGRPVHSYGVYTRNEFWTHSDLTGEFFVISLDDLDGHSGDPVAAKVAEAHHGKLLWDENSHLERHGFATSTGERFLFVIDMEEKKQIGAYNFTDDLGFLPYPNYCQGLHAISYSEKNNHVYTECTAGGGTLEFDVSNPDNPVFVHQHKEATGALYETPDGYAVLAADKGGNKLHVFKPNGTGEKSSIDFVVDVPGHPSTPTFYPKSGGALNPSSYIACMPLTENTNKNNMDVSGSGELKCDYYGCSQATTADDVASGVCLYDATSERNLQEATLEDMTAVENGEAPFGNACAHCTNPDHFDEDGVCVCTPFCGSCADPNYDASQTGVRCVDLGDVFDNGLDETVLIKGAGAVKQGSPYAYSPQCGFGRTYRTSKRGGIYSASVAHIPFNSLQIINMKTQEHKCAVPLPGSPDRVIYVPPQPSQHTGVVKSISEGLSGGGIAGIVIGSLAVMGIITLVVSWRGGGGASHSDGIDHPSNTVGAIKEPGDSAVDVNEGNMIA
eukprot:CAMPEP_0117047064 /NCGR_PEP_ID=MMETSP0472-20121206/32533_1 /TAXON_ID=693140 ORGANISM="Tiarina fusus, Strain LIS" /NCGR_SAMPLE_ID=MMETSP0472 /ASSEMBLY_ACC=CAM_ASM_000603 /LENGTH=648 /DNA_ID=CAMNT_0004759637 /DNA_START=63 /DNA_END=2009 /DNA_ORIENTATION=+